MVSENTTTSQDFGARKTRTNGLSPVNDIPLYRLQDRSNLTSCCSCDTSKVWTRVVLASFCLRQDWDGGSQNCHCLESNYKDIPMSPPSITHLYSILAVGFSPWMYGHLQRHRIRWQYVTAELGFFQQRMSWEPILLYSRSPLSFCKSAVSISESEDYGHPHHHHERGRLVMHCKKRNIDKIRRAWLSSTHRPTRQIGVRRTSAALILRRQGKLS